MCVCVCVYVSSVLTPNCFHSSYQGQLGQGLTSVIHQVEEGLGFTDSRETGPQDSSRGDEEKEGPGQDGDTKPGGEQTGTAGNQPSPSDTATSGLSLAVAQELSCKTFALSETFDWPP